MRSFEEIAEEQGWNDASKVAVLLEYVANQGSEDALADHAETVAQRENDSTNDELDWTREYDDQGQTGRSESTSADRSAYE
jgi:hypothetical protein